MLSLLRSNLAWILLSIAISTGLWIFVTFQRNPDVTNTIGSVQVEVQNPPKGVLVEPAATSVQVKVSAPADVWSELKVDKFRAIVDASRVGPGVQEVPVEVITNDSRVRVEGIDPDKIALRVDPVKTKVVPVQVATQGTVPLGYKSGAVVTAPIEVTLSGPQSSIDQVTAVVVDLNLDGTTRTVDQTFRPIPETASGAKVDRVTLSPEVVVVQVPVEQMLSYKTVPVQPKVQGNVALGYQIVGELVDPQTITLVGDPKTLNELQFVYTSPVNVDGATSDREVSTDFALPGTVALASSQQGVVRVLVAMADGSKTLQVSPGLVNGAVGLNYAVSPGSVNVTLSGPIPVLSHLGPEDVPVTIDVRGMITGTQNLRADVKVPQLVKLDSLQPSSVTVTVK